MQLISFSLLALFAAGSFALPAEDVTVRDAGHIIEARCSANLPICGGARDLGHDNCACKGQVAPCGNWKCGWDGPHSIMNCGSKGSGCSWIN